MSSATRSLSAAGQKTLASRLQSGDQEVLRAILHQFGGIAAHHLRSILPSLKDADLEEVLGEALFRLWNARDCYDESKGTLLNWFINIARNVALDSLKLSWRQVQLLERPFSLADMIASKQNEASLPRRSAAQDDLQQILGTLGETDRRIIHAYACLSGTGNWTHALVDELGLSPGALRTRAHRIMTRLRREMLQRGYVVLQGALGKASSTEV